MGLLSSVAQVAAPAVGAYFGGPIGAAAGTALSNFMGTQATNDANAERADAANAWSASQYASRWQTTVADMKAAGLNPMLAYSQGVGNAPTAQQVTFQNPTSSATQAYKDIRGTEASSSRDYASASQAEAQVKLIESNVDKVKEEIKNIPLEGRRLERLSALLSEQLNVAFQETQSKIASIKVMEQTVKKLRSETSLLDNQVAVEQSLSTLGRTTKELAPAASILLDIIRASKR